MERRRSRDSFTRSLKRICKRIDDRKVFDIEYRYDFLPGLQQSRLRVNALWVVGSYARGALLCGDLDLLADICAEEGSLPLTSTVSRCVIGRPPDVRLYIGTPEENSSGVVFPEARLVWAFDAPDWNAAIEAIPADPAATRFKRPHDILPLRKEQVTEYGDENTFEKIVGLLDQEVLTSKWVPISSISLQPETWSYDASDFSDKIKRWCGKKTREVMLYVIEWFKDNNKCDLWHRDYSEKLHFKIGGMEVFIGRPCIDVRLLDSLSCSAIVIVPHLSRRGPNGIWILSRGTKHSIARAFGACQAYYLTYSNCPCMVQEIDGWRHIHSIELFRQKEQAVNRQKEIKEDDDVDFDVAKAAGTEILSLISCVDVLEIDSIRFAITHDGQIFDETGKMAEIEEIVSCFVGKS